MIRTVEAVIEADGTVRLLEPIQVPEIRRVLVLIFEGPETRIAESALLSERSLAEDWNRPEEDAAWSHLKQAP